MKKIYILIAVALLAWSCGKSYEEQRAELKAQIKKELANNKRAIHFVDKMIEEMIVKQGKAGFEVMDTGQFPIATFPLAHDSVNYLVGEDMAVLGVLMRNQFNGDTLKVDFKLQWDPNIKVNDSTMGGLKLIAAEIRAMKGKERYRWVKQGEYYIKQAKVLQ
ncbi:MAG: hypothetical protein RMJ87_11500 [Cytophagales bacterium]|nr:hypothetical protein [Bernardetiaceae bacterium]MDW8205645.1 hypothetical protein [Cytophagales bacterium]